jgi:hypothetical protein
VREESGKWVRDECTQGEQGEGRRVSLGDMGEGRGNWRGTVRDEITPVEHGEGARGLQKKELVRDKGTLGEPSEGRGDCEVRGESRRTCEVRREPWEKDSGTSEL